MTFTAGRGLAGPAGSERDSAFDHGEGGVHFGINYDVPLPVRRSGTPCAFCHACMCAHACAYPTHPEVERGVRVGRDRHLPGLSEISQCAWHFKDHI